MDDKIPYQRTFEELEKTASKFWPAELSELEAGLSVVPLLIETQEQFISILSVDTFDLESFFQIVEASSLPTNLFLKHLVMLADFGGEPLKRISRNHEFSMLFPDGRLNFSWHDRDFTYDFRALPHKKFSNNSLHIDGRHLAQRYSLDDLKKDAIALLLFGSLYRAEDEKLSDILSKCQIGEYLGKPQELIQFVKQRYIWVSRITGGAKANNLGQLAQKFVAKYVEDNILLDNISVHFNGRLPGVTHTDQATGRQTSFDLIVSNGKKYVAIEVSFQVTTNSTFERKSGQAKDRFDQVEAAGHRIAYVIDGSGNFEREQALRTILSFSHCSVAFSRSELNILCNFLKEFFQSNGTVRHK